MWMLSSTPARQNGASKATADQPMCDVLSPRPPNDVPVPHLTRPILPRTKSEVLTIEAGDLTLVASYFPWRAQKCRDTCGSLENTPAPARLFAAGLNWCSVHQTARSLICRAAIPRARLLYLRARECTTEPAEMRDQREIICSAVQYSTIAPWHARSLLRRLLAWKRSRTPHWNRYVRCRPAYNGRARKISDEIGRRSLGR
jgi:hypothetical protein